MQVIVFTGGGTGGHVFPGIAVLQSIRKSFPENSFRVVWIGSQTGIEKTIAEAAGLEYRAIATGKLRRYLDWKNVTDLARIVKGYFQSKKILRELRPVFVFSKGGFVSVPPVRAARALKIPVYSHESDLDPGLATRLNLGASRLVFCAYQESLAYYPEPVRSKVVVSGNPVRGELLAGDPRWLRREFKIPEGTRVVLVLGGSLGAVQLNDLVARSLALLPEDLFVVHQTGNQWTAPPDSPRYAARPFFPTQMPELYAGADVIVGRAGAGTLWEAAATGVPLVLLPLEAGSRGDQVRNAELFAARGAAAVLRSAAPDDLVAAVTGLLDDPLRLQKAKEALRSFDAAGAAQRIAAEIFSRHSEVPRV